MTFMSQLTIKTLKQICEKIPEDYFVTFEKSEFDKKYLSDKIEVDISNETLILKE